MKLFSKTFFAAGAAAMVVALSAQAGVNLDNLPLWFEAGQGQDDAAAKFTAHGRDAEFSITPAGAEFMLHQAGGHPATVRMTFTGASLETRLAGDNALGGKINYLLGNDPAQWQSGVPTYGKIRLDQVYPGVNVVYYGNQRQLEYDFDLAAGVNPATIAIRFDGAEKLSVDPQGELVVQLDGGQIIQHEPAAYQTVSGVQQAVKAGYKIVDDHTVTFAVGNFDRTQPLVIDPVLSYSTFFGGNSGETAWAIAVNPTDDSVYIAGQTFSTLVSNTTPVLEFTKSAIYTNFSGGKTLGDAFVAKIDNTGTNLVFATYLGGKGDNAAYAIAVDSSGNAYVAGATDSTNFPVTNSLSLGTYSGTNMHGVYNKTYGIYPLDAFVSKLSPDGSSLLYSSYLGGSSWDAAYGIAVDPGQNVYVTGLTYSSNFPVTISTALRTNLMCTNNFYTDYNAFVAEIGANGTALNYSTYLGGTNRDVGNAIAYNNGMVFVAGSTLSTNFPWTNGLVTCTNLNGFTNATPGSDAFVTAFTTSGTNLLLQYSTFLGGSNNDVATGIAGDSSGNAYVVGWTTSTNFPDSTNGVQLDSFVHTNATGLVFATNAFLTQITWNGSKAAVGFSSVFGGFGVDVANGVALDGNGNVFVVGSASSTNFPVTGNNLLGGLRATNSSPRNTKPDESDVFVTAFAAGFSNLLYSTYLGGSVDDFGYGIAVDSVGNAYVTGQTSSTNFPTLGAWSPHPTNSPAVHHSLDGTNDAFVTKIFTTYASPPLSIKKSGTNVLVYWQPFSDVTPATLGLETTTNLLLSVTLTNLVKSNNIPVATNIYTVFNTNWTVITNQFPVLTNNIAPTNIYNYIYTFDPTNRVRFYRFHVF